MQVRRDSHACCISEEADEAEQEAQRISARQSVLATLTRLRRHKATNSDALETFLREYLSREAAGLPQQEGDEAGKKDSTTGTAQRAIVFSCPAKPSGSAHGPDDLWDGFITAVQRLRQVISSRACFGACACVCFLLLVVGSLQSASFR